MKVGGESFSKAANGMQEEEEVKGGDGRDLLVKTKKKVGIKTLALMQKEGQGACKNTMKKKTSRDC